MAPIALSPTLKPTLLQAPIPDVVTPEAKYTDWRADLQRDGYVVIKNAIPRDRAVAYQQRALAWAKSFSEKLDVEKPETWISSNLPVPTSHNIFMSYGVAHESFMWEARMEPGVLAAFELLWGTDKLLASFDALNITFPNRKDVAPKKPWEHIDQSPFRRGVHCVQGIISLSDSGPEDGGLLVYPGSHKFNDEFFDTQTDKATWTSKDWYLFTRENLQWYKSKGCTPRKVCAGPGDLVLWDSRTMHYGAEPTEKGRNIRTAIYAAYTPARLASKEFLEKKREVFSRWAGTTHWPHDNIVIRDARARFADGTPDERDTGEPREKPVLSQKLLRLAGVEGY